MNTLIKETLEILCELRGEIDCEDNVSAIQQIDVAIANLKEISNQSHSEEQESQLCLQALGKAIRFIPWVVRIIELMEK